MRWGDVKSPVRKPQLRNIDSVNVQVDPFPVEKEKNELMSNDIEIIFA